MSVTRTTILAASAAIVAAVAACAHQPTTGPAQSPSSLDASSTVAASPTSSASTMPATPTTPGDGTDLGAVDETDAGSVADAVAVALSVHDARTDATSQSAQVRASQWYGGDLAASPRAAGETELPRPSRRWAMMVSRQAWDTVDEIDRRIDDPVADTDTTAMRQRAVTVRAHDAGGWSGLVITNRYWLTLTRQDGVWRVTTIRATADS